MSQVAWGGDVKMPRWLRRLMHRRELPADTPEAAHEKRKPPAQPSVIENSSRALSGSLLDFYNDGRKNKGH